MLVGMTAKETDALQGYLRRCIDALDGEEFKRAAAG
jgi:hypothetical protein